MRRDISPPDNLTEPKKSCFDIALRGKLIEFEEQNLSARMPEEICQKPIRALLFDMDNTLFDLVGAQIAACDCVVRHLGHDDGDELFSCFLTGSHGFESTENIRQYMQERRIPTNGMSQEACRIYATEKLRHITPYPGVTKTLRAIRGMGFPTGIVTDAEKADATLRLDKCGLSPFFDCRITFDMVGVKKPAPDPFLTALGTISARRNIPFLSATVPGGISNPVKNWGSVQCMPGTGTGSQRPGIIPGRILSSIAWTRSLAS